LRASLEAISPIMSSEGNGAAGRGKGTGCPAGVADADHPMDRLAVEPPGEIVELALGPPPLDLPVDQGCDPGRVIAAVFETAQSFNEPRRDCLPGDDADDPAHQCFLRSRARIAAARPGLSTCRPRLIDNASGATSRVTTLPAATIAPAPTVTGATSAVFEPINAPSPIIVRSLLTPS
jgi:hypothetical protein